MPVPNVSTLSRRRLLGLAAAGTASVALSACASTPRFARLEPEPQPEPVQEPPLDDYATMYAAVVDGGFEVPAVPIQRMDPQYLRQIVADPTGEAPGTLVVDTSSHFLYLVRENRQAIRYGVGLGREGFEWAGRGVIKWKQAWPRWFPPEEMIARQPELEKYRAIQIPGTNEWEGGMPAGPSNPLGARALYIFQDDKDTLFRLHGSPEWSSIGKSVSSGCVRFMHQDIIDLYDRVPDGTPILVAGGVGMHMVDAGTAVEVSDDGLADSNPDNQILDTF